MQKIGRIATLTMAVVYVKPRMGESEARFVSQPSAAAELQGLSRFALLDLGYLQGFVAF